MSTSKKNTVAPVHNPRSEYSIFDEAFLGCSDGHCLFDEEGKLVSWSDSFGKFYLPIIDKIIVGYDYVDFLRDLMEHQVLKNLKPVDNLNKWLDQQQALIRNASGQFIHHLQDDRVMLIKHVRLSNQYWFFAAFNISELRAQREQLVISENKFREFAQLSSDWFWELDSKLCYLYHSSHNNPIGYSTIENMVGTPRIDHVSEHALHNEQLKKHNEQLRAHLAVDVVLSWPCREQNNGQIQSEKHTHIQARPVHDKNGIFTGFIGYGKDITASFILAQQMEHLASHDDLTGLLNRRAFTEVLDSHMARIDPDAKSQRTFVFIDLDQFKLVNDGAGHQAGDQLLKQTTQVFKNTFGPEAIIARIGGDEFGVIFPGDATTTLSIVEELIKNIGEHKFEWLNRLFTIGASAGLIEINDNCISGSELMSCADIACYGAKVSGRNQAQLYSPHNPFHRKQNEELSAIKLLNDSISNNDLRLFLQPLIPTGTGNNRYKFEVLLRILNEGRIIPPGNLIAVAEKYDRMQQIDLWVVENSIEQLQLLHASGVECSFSINLSGNSLSDKSCLEKIDQLVEEKCTIPDALCFEITETSAIKGMEKASNFIKDLKKMGCEFALDDFGCGLSSFSYLNTLDVDYLKIDGSFVKKIEADHGSLAIVKSFNTLGHEMGMKTVAEFVENTTIADLLTEIGIDYLQGFGVGEPRSIELWYDELTTIRMTGT